MKGELKLMDINDYKPNSHKYREEQKQLANAPKKTEKVIKELAYSHVRIIDRMHT